MRSKTTSDQLSLAVFAREDPIKWVWGPFKYELKGPHWVAGVCDVSRRPIDPSDPSSPSPVTAASRLAGWILGFVRSRIPFQECVRDVYSLWGTAASPFVQRVSLVLPSTGLSTDPDDSCTEMIMFSTASEPQVWTTAFSLEPEGCGHQMAAPGDRP